ncbi:MAG TPA: DEAD/DEAH box helicase [Gammaproteobacteria bacterium]|nr:DEAD/DEAH box helicase [Gammaproteobacteria bacterium]
MSFENLGLSAPLVQALHEKGYREPSPIQLQSIKAILKKIDLMACAQTGTGKTAGFVLPILELLSMKIQKNTQPRALIIAPTRELAIQIHKSIMEYGKNLTLTSTSIYGGVKVGRQIKRLSDGVDILVATPGRLLDLYQQRAVQLNNVEMLVLDEADRMLDMGFVHDIKKIISRLPKKRQTLLFSATFSDDINKFAKGLLSNYEEIKIAPKVTSAASVQHKIHPVDKSKKFSLLIHLIQKNNWYQALTFIRTKHSANKLVKLLNQNNIRALAIHGNISQLQRVNALESFKQGKIQILVATDIASRGIDIAGLSQVINFDLPNVPEDYVHRIGRTGRAGSSGQAISLVSAEEIKQLNDIEKILKSPIKRETIEGFEPVHALPSRVKQGTSSKRKPERTEKNSFDNSFVRKKKGTFGLNGTKKNKKIKFAN